MEPYGKWLKALEFNNVIRVYGHKITFVQKIFQAWGLHIMVP